MDLVKARSAVLFAAAGLCLSAAAGIARRYSPAVIASLSGSFSGRTLHGRDRIDVVAYMATLTGAKVFPDPG